TTFVSCATTGGVGGVCGGSANNRTGTFNSIPANATATVTIVARVDCSAGTGVNISNTATVGSGSIDSDPSDNTSLPASAPTSDPAPVITCPANLNVATAAPGDTSVVVNYPAPAVTDNCPGATVVCTPPSGSSFPLGATVVNCTATDTGGNTASC